MTLRRSRAALAGACSNREPLHVSDLQCDALDGDLTDVVNRE